MSVILEADEVSPHGSQTPTTEGAEDERTDEVSQNNTSQQDGDQPKENSEENGDDGTHVEEDTGGGGDTEGGEGGEIDKEVEDLLESKENVPSANADETASSLKENEAGSVSKVSGSKTSSKKSIESPSKGEGEGSPSLSKDSGHTKQQSDGTHATSSSESFSSGFRIVMQILEELIDAVMKTKELEEKAERVSEQRDDDTLHSSIVTIKSEDEEGSVVIDPELQTQLALEQEAAALQRKQTYQENIALYHALIASRLNLRRRNTFLLKQMYENYKRKKIEHLFKEMHLASVDMEGKYVRVLLAYEEAHNAVMEEETKMAQIISTLDEKKQLAESDFEEELNTLINREQEIAKGILSSQATKHLSAKDVENLIQKQLAKSQEVAKERLIYFKLRDAAASDESYLKSLENLGEGLTLMEYEQLKMQSQSCVEKLEERDADLHRLRCKATSAIQVLAEIREKTHKLQEDIEVGKVVLHEVNQHLIQTRERVGCEKRRRDMSRSDTIRLRQEAGLLSEPKLLQDYKESLSLKENLLEQLQEWKTKFESQKQNILSLRSDLAALQQKGDRTG